MKYFNNKMYIVAEIGLNHNGKIILAKKLIEKAKFAGADAVKIQTYDTNELYNKKFTNSKIFKNMKRLELKKNDVIKLKKFCKKKKIDFFSTPFDIKSAIFLNKIGIKKFKVASSNIRNIKLLNKLKSFNKDIILSSGYSDIKSLKKIVKFFNKKKLAILYCVSLYPAPIKYINLNQITEIKKISKYIKVGFSDHSEGINQAISSKIFGAEILEKHLKLSKNQKCPDSEVSVNPNEFKKMVNIIRNFESIRNQVPQNIMRGEIGVYFNKNKKKGQKILLNDLDFKRPSTKFPNEKLYKYINLKLKFDVKKNNPLDANLF